MKRMRVLFGQRRMQLLVTAAVLLLAAGVVVGSGANFSTSAASADNVFTAGIVGALPNDAMLLDLGPMAPGNTYTGTVEVENSGNVAGNFYMAATDVLNYELDGATLTATDLASRLEVRITPWGAPQSEWISLPALEAGSDMLCGSLDPGTTGQVVVEVQFINGDLVAGSRGADNAYQEIVTKATLNWIVVSTPEV
ncbi:MAG: hypothetical protein JW767_04460 [Thermoleophilia bacterium]|nr:hypothetical protein [Thermoleophilia bacterium]